MPNYQRGEERVQSKLTRHDVDLILELREHGLSQQKIAEKFDVSRSCIAHVVHGRSWVGV